MTRAPTNADLDSGPLVLERRAIALVGGRPIDSLGGDHGIDGVIEFPTDDPARGGRALVSIKTGGPTFPCTIRDLEGAAVKQQAQLAVLVTEGEPCCEVRDAAADTGFYRWPIDGTTYPRVQVVPLDDLLAGRTPELPAT